MLAVLWWMTPQLGVYGQHLPISGIKTETEKREKRENGMNMGRKCRLQEKLEGMETMEVHRMCI